MTQSFLGRPTVAAALTLALHASPSFADSPDSWPVSYRTTEIGEVSIAYREAGPADAPVMLLLHGFPSSSHMFRDLIPEIAGSYRVIAPDYPGFGQSAAPAAEHYDYDFATLAETMNAFVEDLGLSEYMLYMQDYGGPVGMRLAVAHPERVSGLVFQNATVHVDGWSPEVVARFTPFWTDRTAETEAPVRGFLAPETTRWQYAQGSTRSGRLSPDAWVSDQAGLDRPGNDAVQLEYLWNYRDNVASYPAWQAYLAREQPPTLIAWGANDPFFTMEAVTGLQALMPDAETRIFDAGHFALETHAPEIGAAIRDAFDH
ncbi:alpha/beta fold hydrolase [Phaeobacter sp. S60]|jgi:pimeloyl-ACP methyl ester carboxylesterase|uniref:alpha/beta fold hydrolase n=1 Tax=Phaeobacter sp. S60 TaxID=1569353 RepID=UPI00058D4D80|nr:alpha/beta fold hydrolase [Phaeobacter sp. S60]KII15404.1 alpha/beta hydrolase [Phaeobacter sp. S60]